MKDLSLITKIEELVNVLDDTIEQGNNLSYLSLKAVRKALEESREELIKTEEKKQKLLSMITIIKDL